MLSDYLPILVVFIAVSAFAFISLGITHVLGPRVRSKVKMMPYESGVDPVAETRIRFSIKYFLIALMFIIFDIEIVFLYPWAVVFNKFLSEGAFIFYEMVIFLAILGFGYVFVWRKGALEWE